MNSKVKMQESKFGSEKINTFPERNRTNKQKKKTQRNRKKNRLAFFEKTSIFDFHTEQYMALNFYEIQEHFLAFFDKSNPR